ncbi:hypothetical protein KSP40_PGU014021 [Platanthera guangdongensis]|uniref:Fungal lipase-type domain-containing protein n=1 Tax=Platanthera guangdongensis TaxID=2320717 RepID=A0ABR2LPA4_9ASPA
MLPADFLSTDVRDGEAIPPPSRSDAYQQLLSGLLNRRLSQQINVEDEKTVGNTDSLKDSSSTADIELVRDSSDDDDSIGRKWKVEPAWLSKALEPALQLYKWASTAGIGEKKITPPSTRSLSEILTDLQASKAGIQEWSLSDLTVGLYLIHLSQASAAKVEDFNGEQINSELMVQKLIYHLELAKGCYKDSTSSVARHCMLRERNILKFVKDSSLLRPGYYVGVDTRNKLVILAIRGTHTVYDLITNLVSSSDQNVSFEGFSTHFGTAEAARWFLHHEMGTIRRLLEKHRDFRLRLVGHSLGGAAAALLAIMLRRKSAMELGFSPDIVSAVGFGTPPCVSKELAESCVNYVSTVVLQDDIVPRLSVASLARLRNEILETDCVQSSIISSSLRSVIVIVIGAPLVLSLLSDYSRQISRIAKRRRSLVKKNWLMGFTSWTSTTIFSPLLALSFDIDVLGMPLCASFKKLFQICLSLNSHAITHVFGYCYIGRPLSTTHQMTNYVPLHHYCWLLMIQHGSYHMRIFLFSHLVSSVDCDYLYFAQLDVFYSTSPSSQHSAPDTSLPLPPTLSLAPNLAGSQTQPQSDLAASQGYHLAC